MKITKQNITIIGLSVALFVSAEYFVFDALEESNEEQVNQAFQTGYEQGIIDSVTSLYTQTEDCRATTITLGNLTKQVFDLACVTPAVESPP